MLKDIAIVTGATVISDDMGMTFDNISMDVLGTAKKVVVSKDSTLLAHGGGDKKAIAARATKFAMQFPPRPAIMTGKSCLSAWQSWSAVLPLSKLAA